MRRASLVAPEDLARPLGLGEARHLADGNLPAFAISKDHVGEVLSSRRRQTQRHRTLFVANRQHRHVATVETCFQHAGQRLEIDTQAVGHGTVELDPQLGWTALERRAHVPQLV